MHEIVQNFTKGLKAGIPIALGYVSVSFTFGIIAVSYGFYRWQAVLISLACLTSAGQFSGITTMLLPGQYLDMLVSQLTINIRYSFMSISLSQKVNKRFSVIWRLLFGAVITDEIFAVAVSEQSVSRSFMAGLALLPYLGWGGGTALGAILGNVLPARIMSALGLAIYGMFIAIVTPEMRRHRPVIFTVIVAALLSACFTYVPVINRLSSGLAISVCAIVSALLASVLYPISTDDTANAADPAAPKMEKEEPANAQ